MNFEPTCEQLEIIGSPLICQRVVACAGSGKTATAVRRLSTIRRALETSKGRVALLSYSNVAVDTFRREYEVLSEGAPGLRGRVLIATVDSFITTHILSPYANRSMQCERQPFLVRGTEAFLAGFKVFNGSYNVDIKHLKASLDSAAALCFAETSMRGKKNAVSDTDAQSSIERLGKLGAYTHELGRYWVLHTIANQPRLLEILARRYPFILIDEAQDVGSMHGAFLDALRDAGAVFTLIGDPNQAIYEFADADGRFLSSYDVGSAGKALKLTLNQRSTQSIVDVANTICGTAYKSARLAPTRKSGAYFLTYVSSQVDQLLDAFSTMLDTHGYARTEGVVLCRGKTMLHRLGGGSGECGQGATEFFAEAAIYRDRHGDIANALENALDGALCLLDGPSPTLRFKVLNGSAEALPRALRRLIWRFVKFPATGIPAAGLKAIAQWLPALKKNVKNLLAIIEAESQLVVKEKWTYRLTAKDLTDDPLWSGDLIATDASSIVVKTVHRAKGESIPAVLYAMTAPDTKNLLAGPIDEEGRIGYVAISRARDLLVVAVPQGLPAPVFAALQAKGFVAWAG